MNRIKAFMLLSFVLAAAWTMPAFADKIEDSVVGLYTENGYTNDYFGFQLNLPGDFTLNNRGWINLVNEDVLESANKETTISSLKTQIGLSYAKVFMAESANSYITITVESPGIQKDYWDEESVVANNTEGSISASIQEDADKAGATVTDIITKTDSFKNFAGNKHYTVLYKYTWNGTQLNGMVILMRSKDRKLLCEITIESSVGSQMEEICSYFSEYDAG